MKYWASEWFPH